MLEFSPEAKPNLYLWGKLAVQPSAQVRNRDRVKRMRKKLYIDEYMNHQFHATPSDNMNLLSSAYNGSNRVSPIGLVPRLSPKVRTVNHRHRKHQSFGSSFKLDEQRSVLPGIRVTPLNRRFADGFKFLPGNRHRDCDSFELAYKNDKQLPGKYYDFDITSVEHSLTPWPQSYDDYQNDYANIGSYID